MKHILLLKPRGFCAGVHRAIEMIESLLQKGPVYVKHEIVHNTYVVEKLKSKGAIFVNKISDLPMGVKQVIFSAHGSPKSDFEYAEKMGIEVIDATCPIVSQIHQTVSSLSKRDYHIVVIGHQEHVEIVGTIGHIYGQYHIVENVDDVAKLNIDPSSKIGFVCQTTLSTIDTADIKMALKKKFPHIKESNSGNVCYATYNRQLAIIELAQKADVLLVVGSPNSSNSNRLVEIGNSLGIPSFLIDNTNDLEFAPLDNSKTIAITAGASASEVSVQELLKRIEQKYQSISVEEIGKTEDVLFSPPKKARSSTLENMEQDYGHTSIAKILESKNARTNIK